MVGFNDSQLSKEVVCTGEVGRVEEEISLGGLLRKWDLGAGEGKSFKGETRRTQADGDKQRLYSLPTNPLYRRA